MIVSKPIAAAATALVCALSLAGYVRAGDKGAIAIENVWARATPGGATVGAVYGEIRNDGSAADVLKAIATPAAGRAELHTHTEVDGVMKMRRIDAIEIAAGGSAVLTPGHNHIMLFDLAAALKSGEKIPLTFTFEQAGPITVEANIQPIGSAGPPGAGNSTPQESGSGSGSDSGSGSGSGSHN